MRITGLLLVVVVLLQGCSINQKVTPVAGKGIAELTVIENPAVKNTFLDALKKAVEEQGVAVQVGPAAADPEDYPYAMTYTANWTWDMALYLVYTEINVFEKGEEIGKAVYDSRRGGARMDKFINAENKVKELVGELFGSQPSEQ